MCKNMKKLKSLRPTNHSAAFLTFFVKRIKAARLSSMIFSRSYLILHIPAHRVQNTIFFIGVYIIEYQSVSVRTVDNSEKRNNMHLFLL
jgi:hypothetical protein